MAPKSKKSNITVIDSCQVHAVTPIDSWHIEDIDAAYKTAVKSLETKATTAAAKIDVESGTTTRALRLSNIAHQLVMEEIFTDSKRSLAVLLSSATYTAS